MKSRRTKVVATIGPASNSPEVLTKLVKAGVNVFRLNMSHGNLEAHAENISRIRKVCRELNAYVAILLDLAGPKIRISEVPTGFAPLADGATVILKLSDGSLSTSELIQVESVNPAKTLKAGHHVLLADGLIVLVAREVREKEVVCDIIKGGRIRSRVGIAFPDSKVDLPAATEKDLKDLGWGLEQGVDYVAVSFVNHAADIVKVKDFVQKAHGDVGVIAKIERRTAVDEIDEILEVSDGIMVARGDLGVELPLEKVPLIQKKLIEKANYLGKPVIVATQMLQSMVTSLRPTRAEVSDVATAVMSGADAVMLSEETAIGENPVACVDYLDRISKEAETDFVFETYRARLKDADRSTVPDAVAYAAAAAAVKVDAGAIIACTETGNTARLVAKYRPNAPLYGVSSSERTLRRMALMWGINAINCAAASTHFDEIQTALRTVQLRESLPNGTRAVITGGVSVRIPGSTSILEIREMMYRS